MDIRDVLEEIVISAGFKDQDIVLRRYWPPYSGWYQISIDDRSLINKPFKMIVGINEDGRIWINKAVESKFLFVNIHDPTSIANILQEILDLRENHYVFNQR